MSDTHTPVHRFFELFEHNSDSGDVSASVAQFADVFMAAGPHGAQCVRSVDFAQALPKRIQLFKSLGCQRTSLDSLEVMRLDDRFVMARTRWRMTFQGAKEAMAESMFIVDTATDPFKIVFYLAHQDHMSVLKEASLFAEA